MSLHGKRCLILSSSWFPIGIEALQTSLTKLGNQGKSQGKTFIIDCVVQDGKPYFERYTLNQWVNRIYESMYTLSEWVSMGHNPDIPVIKTGKLAFQIPEVIMKSCNRPFIQKLPLRASNVFARDGHRCWYCGSEENLTLDHIIPQARGGKNSWKNLVTSCYACNHEKGEMDISKFCRIKGCDIPKPVNVGSFPWLKQLGRHFPESWKYHLEGLQINV